MPRDTLATIGGFTRPRASTAHGTQHASFVMCQALAEVGGYREIHVYQDPPRQRSKDLELALPRTPRTLLFEKMQLPSSGHRYGAIHVANGEQISSAPHVLRPSDDWAPVICSVGTAHIAGQWLNLLASLASGATRPTDGLIFKSGAAQRLFQSVWADWNQRLQIGSVFPENQIVVPNGVDVEVNKRSEVLREDTRRRFGLRADDVVFLAFSRLSPGTKGDQLALLVRWKSVLARCPRALLVLAGLVVERDFVGELRTTARAAGVADRVLILDNPFDLMPDARDRLMSAADAFLHLTTGLEEASSMVVHEAMAYGLPVLATNWAGLGEVVVDGENGFLLETSCLPPADNLVASLFAASHIGLARAGAQLVTCDWGRFVDCAAGLADPERRRRMGAAARASIEGRTIQMVARRYADFFRDCARSAEQQWPSAAKRYRPLVDLAAVLRAQGAAPLSPERKVRLADFSAVTLLAMRLPGQQLRRLKEAFELLGNGAVVALGDLAACLEGKASAGSAGATASPAAGEPAMASQGALLARLLNYGALELVAPAVADAPAVDRGRPS